MKFAAERDGMKIFLSKKLKFDKNGFLIINSMPKCPKCGVKSKGKYAGYFYCPLCNYWEYTAKKKS